jgi:glycosyltransferase involved in cell wall biosynthesis
MLQHRESAVLVSPHDPEAIATAVLSLLRNPALAERLGAAALERYRERYQPATMTRALEDCFAELAARWSHS